MIFDGDYKLREVVEYDTYELYNLKSDPLETENLATSQPEILQQMLKKLRAWEVAVAAQPLTKNPDYVLPRP